MTTVSATSAATPATQSDTAEAARKASLDYDAFLNLLVAQMKNQDPTNPMDSAEYMGQLASFSSVEQSIQTNQKLDNMLAQMSITQADGLIGKTVTSPDGVSGTVESVKIYSDGAIATLADGKQVLIGPGVTIS